MKKKKLELNLQILVTHRRRRRRPFSKTHSMNITFWWWLLFLLPSHVGRRSLWRAVIYCLSTVCILRRCYSDLFCCPTQVSSAILSLIFRVFEHHSLCILLLWSLPIVFLLSSIWLLAAHVSLFAAPSFVLCTFCILTKSVPLFPFHIRTCSMCFWGRSSVFSGLAYGTQRGAVRAWLQCFYLRFCCIVSTLF